jgi:hypothetical protein
MSTKLPDAGPERESGRGELVLKHMRKYVDGSLDAESIALLTQLYGEPNADGIFTGSERSES